MLALALLKNNQKLYDKKSFADFRDTTFSQNIQYAVYVVDSIKVECSNKLVKMHYPSSDANESGNLCNENCYELVEKLVDGREEYRKYKFTFDPIPELDSKQ